MLLQLGIAEVLPASVLKVSVDAFDLLGHFTHPLVVSVMINVKFLGPDQLLEDVLILLENVFHSAIRFVDQSVRRLIEAIASKSFLVLEDFKRFGITEEFAEKAQLADGQIRAVVGLVFVFKNRIDDGPNIAPGQHSLNLAAIVLPGIQFP